MTERQEPDYFAMSSSPNGPWPLLLVGYFMLDLIAAAVIRSERHVDGIEMFVFSVFASQVMLLTMWLGLGGTRLRVRLLLALAWGVWFVILASSPRDVWTLENLAGVVLFLLIASAPYGLLKVLGYRMVGRRSYFVRRASGELKLVQEPIGRCSPDMPAETGRRPASVADSSISAAQFSIKQIFAWMVWVGVIATLVRITGIQPEEAVALLIAVCVFSLLGLSTIWAVLGGDVVGARLFAPFALVLLATGFAATFVGPGNAAELLVYVFGTTALTIAVVAGVLQLFRTAGFRLRRARTAGDATGSAASRPTNPWDVEAV